MAAQTAKKKVTELTTEKTQSIATICAHAAADKKASDVIILDVHELSTIADYFVICSAPSDRQVQAIIRNVEDEVKKHGIRPKSIEGIKTASWILLDLGDVIFHCFTDSARQYYDLEGFWIDAPRIDWT